MMDKSGCVFCSAQNLDSPINLKYGMLGVSALPCSGC